MRRGAKKLRKFFIAQGGTREEADHFMSLLVLLDKAGGRDPILTYLGGFCRNCDGAGGCMACRVREWHENCEHDCPECGPKPWDETWRQWTFSR